MKQYQRKYAEEHCLSRWAATHEDYYKSGEEDLRYRKISIIDSIVHAASLFDLKRRLEDALNSILSEMKADEFFRRFPKE